MFTDALFGPLILLACLTRIAINAILAIPIYRPKSASEIGSVAHNRYRYRFKQGVMLPTIVGRRIEPFSLPTRSGHVSIVEYEAAETVREALTVRHPTNRGLNRSQAIIFQTSQM
jgi:hypothetical protein